jgi:hypothetical protein
VDVLGESSVAKKARPAAPSRPRRANAARGARGPYRETRSPLRYPQLDKIGQNRFFKPGGEKERTKSADPERDADEAPSAPAAAAAGGEGR